MGHLGSAIAAGIAIYFGTGGIVSTLIGIFGSVATMLIGDWVYDKIAQFFGYDIEKLDHK